MNGSIPSPFRIRGAIEGFYGVFYTAPERDDLIRFLGAHGFTHYIYAPKNDRQHRARWREPYPDFILDQFARTTAIAADCGVAFSYALGPGTSICYSGADDFAAITGKFQAFHACGVRDFHLFLDDIARNFPDPADQARFPSYAAAHADLCNRTYAWLQTLDPDTTLGMCPTAYHGRAPFEDYVHTLGAELHSDIDIFYTGPEICSPTITRQDAAAFASVIQRQPLIWDNYPVNDLAMRPELHVGPLLGRDPDLSTTVKGFYANLMLQAEASKIPLLTIAAYLRNPQVYDPQAAWHEALRAVAGDASAKALRYLAENTLVSFLDTAEAPLDMLAHAALDALQQGMLVEDSRATTQLLDYLAALDDACYHLKFRMQNLALRQNVLPWIELLEHRLWLGRWTIQALDASQRGQTDVGALGRLREALKDSRTHHKRIGGAGLEQLATSVLDQVT